MVGDFETAAKYGEWHCACQGDRSWGMGAETQVFVMGTSPITAGFSTLFRLLAGAERCVRAEFKVY